MAGWRLEIAVLSDRYAVCTLDPEADPPAWALRGSFVSFARTEEESCVVCLERDVPARVRKSGGWRVLRLAGTIDHVAESGVMLAIAEPLARSGISIFPVTTASAGYFLVPESHVEQAVTTLAAWGHTVRDDD